MINRKGTSINNINFLKAPRIVCTYNIHRYYLDILINVIIANGTIWEEGLIV